MRNLVSTLLRTAPLIHKKASPGGVIKRAKYVIRGLAFPRDTAEWFDYLQMPGMAYIVNHHPHLFHKLQRPYLHSASSTSDRLKTLKEHYNFVQTHFSPSLIKEVFVPWGKLLFEMDVKDFGTLEARLYCGNMQKEGDLTIALRKMPTRQRVGFLSFSVWKCGNEDKEIFIGGLQGDKETAEPEVVALTRGLYGLRPKALLFFILQQLAAGWQIPAIRAVSDEKHIYKHFQTRREVNASYNNFWDESGGVLAADKFFDLPAAFVPREISTIRVNKRQLYRRRYAMLDGMAAQIQRCITGAEELSRERESDELAA
jgi:uncharacterized protein